MPTRKIISIPILPSNAFRNYSLLSHTHQPHFSSSPRTNLNSTHSPMPSSGLPAKPKPAQIVPPPLPRSRHTTEIAPTQPHRHAPLLHVSNPPPPSPPPPPCKLPSSMSSDSHPSYPSTHITQSPFRQTHTHLARSTPTRSSRRRPSLVPISLFPDLAAAVLR